ncbi:MAG: hypothetical protein J5I92_05655 [Thiogranum sp.]|nr:hypothetical protein [Thiogranum sp.]
MALAVQFAAVATRPQAVQARLDRFVQGRLLPSERGIIAARFLDPECNEVALHVHFANGVNDHPRQVLRDIVVRDFKQELETLL